EHLGGYSCRFDEFGHLLWRPLGAGVTVLAHDVREGAPGARVVLLRLDALATVFGFGAVAALSAWLYLAAPPLGGAVVGVALLLAGKAFLNFSQVGASYVPALALLSLGLLLLWRAAERERGRAPRALAGGCALSLSVLFWAPFALAVPGALLSALVLRGASRRVVAATLHATAGAAVTGAAALSWAAWELRLGSVAELREWMGDASHGIDLIGGAPRAVIGLARSVVHLGDLGTTVKRYLLSDPLAPASLGDVLGLDLALLAAFYAFALACVVLAARSGFGRGALGMFLLTAGPVGWFAVSWQGGDLERYLPLLPALCLTAAVGFSNGERYRTVRLGAWAFLALVLVVNANQMLTWRLRAAQADVRERLEAAADPDRPRVLVVVTHQDPLWQLGRNHPQALDPYPGTAVAYLLLPGTPQVETWRESFAARALWAWEEGVEMRLSERLLAETPTAGADWIEGDDPRVGWADVRGFVATLDVDRERGASGDGFVRLDENPENRARLEEAAARLGAAGGVAPPCRFPPRAAP
ncbi:MAG TPA: hypothetical protein VK849_07675, partial [Longimicrobiales bacterium]|nr:hypothetical protein [Longimicrobiales bacterium]